MCMWIVDRHFTCQESHFGLDRELKVFIQQREKVFFNERSGELCDLTVKRKDTYKKNLGVTSDLWTVSVFLWPQEDEFYVCIYATREGDHVLFHHQGGVEVGDVDATAQRLLVGVDEKLSEDQVAEQLLTHVPEEKKA